MDNHVIKYIIANYQHYDDVLTRIASVKHTLWVVMLKIPIRVGME